MKGKKILLSIGLVGLTLIALTSCNQSEGTTTKTTVPTVTTTPQAQPAPNDRQPGGPSDNGTMPQPPQGGVPGERPEMSALDLSAAAEKLGITEEQLSEAMGGMTGGPVDMKSIAEKLGVSEEALREALGFTAGGPPMGGPPSDNVTPPPTPETQPSL